MDNAGENLYFSDVHSTIRKRASGRPPTPVPAFFLYGEAPQTPDEATVHVETIAERSRLYDWTILPHRHLDLHQIIVIQSGAVEVHVDRHAGKMIAPGVIHTPPGVVHGFHFAPNTRGWVCSFGSGLAKDLAARSGELREFLGLPQVVSLARPMFLATDLLKLSTMLMREFERTAFERNTALRGLVAAWVANVYRVCHSQERESGRIDSRDRELVAKFREAIERLFREHLTLASYCRSVGVSESQLRRACLTVAGQAPVALIHLRLLVEAERQLRYTAMSVSEVAYFLGFEDPAYFSRFFSRQTGLPPKAYRRQFA